MDFLPKTSHGQWHELPPRPLTHDLESLCHIFSLSVFSHFWCGLKSVLTARSNSLRIFDPWVFIHYWLCLPKGKLSAGLRTVSALIRGCICWSLTDVGLWEQQKGSYVIRLGSCLCKLILQVPGRRGVSGPQCWEKCLVQGQLPKYYGFSHTSPSQLAEDSEQRLVRKNSGSNRFWF